MKKILILFSSFALTLTAVNFAFAQNETESLQPAAKNVYKKLRVNKKLTVGTKKNQGKLLLKGAIKNPNSGKAVVVDDDLEINGDLKVKGTFEKVTVIYTKDLDDGSVTTAKLADEAVTNEKIASNAVTSGKIANGTIQGGDVADGTIASGDIADGTITGSDISSSADLSINDLSAAGNISQDVTKEGLVKGWAYVSSTGTLYEGYNVESASRVATGNYEVKFSFTVWDRVFSVIPSGSRTGAPPFSVANRYVGAVVKSSDERDTVRVNARDAAGSYANSVFMLVVY